MNEIKAAKMGIFIEGARNNFGKALRVLGTDLDFQPREPIPARLPITKNALLFAEIQNLVVTLRGEHENFVDPYLDPLTIMAQTLGGRRVADNWVRTSIADPYEVAGAFFWVVKIISTATGHLPEN